MNADMVLKNGCIYTVTLDGKEQSYEAMAISNGKITGLGTSAELETMIGENTTVINLDGQMVLPAFTESHSHTSFHAERLFTAACWDITYDGGNLEEYNQQFVDRLKAYYKEHPDIKVIKASGWNGFVYPPGQLPTAKVLDQVSTDLPVVVYSFCHHLCWVNTKALELAGITKDTKTPEGSVIHRDSEGNPIGVFQEFAALSLIFDGIRDYDFSVEEYKQALLDYQKNVAAPLGYAMTFDAIPTENGKEAYRQLAKEGKLTMRYRAAYKTANNKPLEQFEKIAEEHESGINQIDDVFQINAVKFFEDGVGPTACYLPDTLPAGPYNRAVWENATYKEAFRICHKHNLQVQVHCIADGSAHNTIEGIGYAIEKEGDRGLRDAIIHACLIPDKDLERMREYGMTAIVQPGWMHALFAGGLQEEIGGETGGKVYPNQSLLDMGIPVAGSCDYPIDGYLHNPLVSIQIGVTRLPKKALRKEGMRRVGPTENPRRECVSLKDMIKEYTINGAYINFLEDITGSLEVGKSADFVILDRNLFELDEDDIEDAKVIATYFKGRNTYLAPRKE